MGWFHGQTGSQLLFDKYFGLASIHVALPNIRHVVFSQHMNGWNANCVSITLPCIFFSLLHYSIGRHLPKVVRWERILPTFVAKGSSIFLVVGSVFFLTLFMSKDSTDVLKYGIDKHELIRVGEHFIYPHHDVCNVLVQPLTT